MFLHKIWRMLSVNKGIGFGFGVGIGSCSLLMLAVSHTTCAGKEPPRYEIQELGRSAWGLVICEDINNYGWVSGSFDYGETFGEARHAVVWIDGEMIDLTPEEYIVVATAPALNDNGVVVGSYITDGTELSGGFRWSNGKFEILPTFAPGHQVAEGINESGYIFGRAMHETFQVDPTAWDPNLNDYQIGTFGWGGNAYDGNGWGQVVGASSLDYYNTHAFLWEDGIMHDIGALPGFSLARAYAINNKREVVGYSGSTLNDHGFYWTEETGMIDLGNLGYAWGSSATDINEDGVIVGYTTRADGRVAAVWHDFQIYDLSTLLVNGDGWRLNGAFGINDLGQIVGMAYRNNVGVGFIATPIDTPMTTIIGPQPGLAGNLNTVEVVEAEPFADVLILYGYKEGKSAVPGCPGVLCDIADPRGIFVKADEDGRVQLKGYIPEVGKGVTMLFQAIDLAKCDATNVEVRKIK